MACWRIYWTSGLQTSCCCAAEAKEAEEKIKETKAKREEFEESREHLNAVSREAARAIADAKEAKAQESRIASAAKSHQKVAETEEQTAARVRTTRSKPPSKVERFQNRSRNLTALLFLPPSNLLGILLHHCQMQNENLTTHNFL
jgi:cytochrome c-type biogenesis protein CcmH/NrfG